MNLQQKYEILADALRSIARYEHCNCGCPYGEYANPPKDIQSFFIAKEALESIGEFIPTMANSFYDKPVSNLR